MKGEGGVYAPVFTLVLPAQPKELVTSTENVPVVLIVICCVVAPVDQRYAANPVPAFRIVESPGQKNGSPEMVGWGAGAKNAYPLPIPLQPLASVTVTEYDPGNDTEMVCEEAPVDHR